MRDRLIEIVKESLVKNIDYTHRLAESITDDLLSEGVIVPPCKVGDMVYIPNIFDEKVSKYRVDEINIGAGNESEADKMRWLSEGERGRTLYV